MHRNRIVSLSILGLFAFLLILSAILISQRSGEKVGTTAPPGAASAATPVPTLPPLAVTPTIVFNPTRTISLSEGEGVPAITPRLAVVNLSTPTFTEGDVRQYVNSHPVGGKISSQGTPVIEKIEFLTKKDLATRLPLGGHVAGLSDDRLLCYVQLSGTFSVAAPPPVVNRTPSSASVQKSMQLFDALTGNLLLTGAGNEIK